MSTSELPEAVHDVREGLRLPSGRVHLDGATALLFVRARQVEVLTRHGWSPNQPGDLGRIARQQVVLAAAIRWVHSANGLGLFRFALAVASGARMDDRIQASDLRLVLTDVRTATSGVRFCVLPTRRQLPDALAMSPFPPLHDGSAVFRVVDSAKAVAPLDWFANAALPSHPPQAC